MTITTQRTTANSPAQAAKNRVRGPTVAARRRSGRSPVRSFASYGGGHGTARRGPPSAAEASAAAAERHDSMMTKARWRGTEAIARETPAGSLSVASMPQRKDYTNDAEHHGKFQERQQRVSAQYEKRVLGRNK
ncbi:hypothetical protein EMIHUDRAFT_219033 [Emiliania huxleyi CCMP1516]|uniref:Uncharacterized protein n=2 Tax=Emiliania huxleyi TaxID=2903 RepID=A0A0D3I5K9_EMIH1|nr:hypothetical protein EMIHUDRAFT_219033 [Emiliania huxleyi CCMP1516]EOD06544.1 hypothetical protein EMIHUDRAFT_219033 [Emiliania huxleyi CCMP1516]|eukprot:XP_005758973.1 hypothetical protein EMIHUDRAFT_219033 [Emiliania huxleyi CCMP1516]